jgi:hypothetical protein
MHNTRAPIILEGQVYYEEARNSYLVVTKRRGETICYAGPPSKGVLGFRGMLEDEQFVERFQPVDPVDLSETEKAELLALCGPGTSLKIGFIKED